MITVDAKVAITVAPEVKGLINIPSDVLEELQQKGRVELSLKV